MKVGRGGTPGFVIFLCGVSPESLVLQGIQNTLLAYGINIAFFIL